jgi:hypothetical protein
VPTQEAMTISRFDSEPTFESTFNAKTTARPRSLRGRVYADSVVMHINKVNSHIYRLTNIETFPERRKWGLASSAMRFLCKLADEFGVQLELCPVQLDSTGLNFLDLVRWYQQFGFYRIGLHDEMIRPPKQEWL